MRALAHDQGRTLLRDTDLVMSEVAERVGYRSEASFNKAFKRLEGIPPGVYRQRRERPRLALR
jgi:AraC-like DNA-binding protein